MKCAKCKKSRLKPIKEEAEINVDEHQFVAEVPAMKCSSCDATFYALSVMQRFELGAAVVLARSGARSGTAMRFMRKALGVPAGKLAELLDLSPEHVSRLENGKAPIDLQLMALLSSMVLDRARGMTMTEDSLRAQHEPKKVPRQVKVNLEELVA